MRGGHSDGNWFKVMNCHIVFKNYLEASVRINALVAEEHARAVTRTLCLLVLAAKDKCQGSMGGHQIPGLTVAVVCSSNMNRQAKPCFISM